jgi:hypothetical protein
MPDAFSSPSPVRVCEAPRAADLSPADIAFVRATHRLADLCEPALGRPPTEAEQIEADRERGYLAGLLGINLRDRPQAYSSAWITGHARGMAEARGDR